jgi:PIN domain nuclease of toxin-antitoxin system
VSKYVLDASAVLALLDDELGADRVAAVLMDAVIGTVNLAEVHTKLAERGRFGRQALAELLSVVEEVVPFTEEHAAITGALRTSTAHVGLSLGDRACLALGIALRAQVYTAERLWAKLQLPCDIHLIR